MIVFTVMIFIFSGFFVFGNVEEEKGVIETGETPLIPDAPKEMPESELENEEEIYIDIEEIEIVREEENEIVEEEAEEVYIELENITRVLDEVEINESGLENDFEEGYENLTDIPLDELVSNSENLSLNESLIIEEINFKSENSAPNGNGENSGRDNYKYLDIEQIIETDEEIFENGKNSDAEVKDKEKITYVSYRENKKEIETEITAEEIKIADTIKKEEEVEESGEEWKKEVKIDSEEDFDNPLTVYTDIIESEEEDIKIYWKENNSYIDFDTYDTNGNGLTDRIS